jgi:CBS domain-containing protein
MKIREIMRPVRTIEKEDTVKKAAKIMAENRIGSLVVISGKKIIGIMTERDLLIKITAQGKSSDRVSIGEIMTSRVLTIWPDASLDDAVYLMIEHKIKKLPVVDETGELVGIVTATDVIANSSEVGEYFLLG